MVIPDYLTPFFHLRWTRLIQWVLILIAGMLTGINAQSIWTPPAVQRRVTLEVLKPSLNNSDYVRFASSVWFLSGTISLKHNTQLIWEIPFVHFDREDLTLPFFPEPSLTLSFNPQSFIGNPYLGFQLWPINRRLFALLGIRLPFSTSSHSSGDAFAITTDFYRFEAFLPNVYTISARFGALLPIGSPALLRIGGGLATTGNIHGSRNELLAEFFGQIWDDRLPHHAGIGFTGRTLITSSSLSLRDRTEIQAGAFTRLNIGRVYPGLHVRIPVYGNLEDIIGVVFGLSVEYALGPQHLNTN